MKLPPDNHRRRVSATRLLNLQPGEFPALAWSFIYFFSLLCAYYIIRPVRDEMGITGGIDNLPWVFSGTFLAMLALLPLFGWLSSSYPRRRLLPAVYGFFILNLLLFFFLFHTGMASLDTLARVFFIWVSVFNLFVVSVFWSLMSDLFQPAQARRLFGVIAAGGSAGALAGPGLTTLLAVPLGTTNLLLVSSLFLTLSLVCIFRLFSWQECAGSGQISAGGSAEAPLGGGWLAGATLVVKSPYLLGICALMLLFTTLSTFLYFQQATIVRDAFADTAERTRVFAAIDLAVNTLTILIQLFVTGRIIKLLNLGWTLTLIPLLLAAGFLLLAFAPVLWVLIAVQVIRRAGNYAIMRPARETLYVVLTREEKYKAKNFIDTAVYRGGDAVSAWFYSGLEGVGFTLSHIAFLAVPLALLWAVVAYRLGRKQEILADIAGTAANHGRRS